MGNNPNIQDSDYVNTLSEEDKMDLEISALRRMLYCEQAISYEVGKCCDYDEMLFSDAYKIRQLSESRIKAIKRAIDTIASRQAHKSEKSQ